MRHVALQLLQLLFRENLHEVMDVQQDAVQVNTVNGLGQEADHSPQTLQRSEQRLTPGHTQRGLLYGSFSSKQLQQVFFTFMTSSENMGDPAVVIRLSCSSTSRALKHTSSSLQLILFTLARRTPKLGVKCFLW